MGQPCPWFVSLDDGSWMSINKQLIYEVNMTKWPFILQYYNICICSLTSDHSLSTLLIKLPSFSFSLFFSSFPPSFSLSSSSSCSSPSSHRHSSNTYPSVLRFAFFHHSYVLRCLFICRAAEFAQGPHQSQTNNVM